MLEVFKFLKNEKKKNFIIKPSNESYQIVDKPTESHYITCKYVNNVISM